MIYLYMCRVSTAEAASLLAPAKDLISSSGFSIEICFELPDGTSEESVVREYLYSLMYVYV